MGWGTRTPTPCPTCAGTGRAPACGHTSVYLAWPCFLPAGHDGEHHCYDPEGDERA